MPLKKPTDIPKIPKTRKKKAESALTAIPEKKPDKIEYYCLSYFKYDRESRKQLHALTIQTVAEFTSFSYKLNVEVIKEKNVINLVIMGITPEINVAPEIKPAECELLLENLTGNFIVNVVKQDGCINSAEISFNIYNKEINILNEFVPQKTNNRLFCKFKVSPGRNSFPASK